MKLIDTLEVLGFAHWASALFNGDTSGMEDEDIASVERWLDQEVGEAAHHDPIDMREEGFRRNVFDGLGGDAATYVAFYPTKIDETPCQHWAERQFRISRRWLHADL